MSKKIIAILLLSVFFVCSIGTVFAYDTNIDNENGNEENTQITENIDEENTDSQEEADKVEESNKDEEVIKKRDGEEEYFNVTFQYENGEIIEVKKVKSGEKVVPPKIKGYYEHEYSWITYTDGKFDFDTPITSDIKLIFMEIPIEVDPPICYIYFHTNGGSKVMSYLSLRLGNPISSSLPKTTKSGCKFLGWFDENDKEWKVGMTPKGSMDLYAKWQPLNLSSPKTGDNNNIILYISMMILAGIGMYLSLRELRKKYN